MPKFGTVVIDPPWRMEGGFNGFGRRKDLPYRSMSIDEITALPIPAVVGREGYVFLWVVNRWLLDCGSIVRAWGLTYRQTVTWAKPIARAGLGGMFGSTTEHVVIAQNIRPGTHAHGPRTRRERIPRSCFAWPVGEHSEKPDAFYDTVQKVSLGPFLDVFARRRREGWTSIGDAIDGRDVLEALGHAIR